MPVVPEDLRECYAKSVASSPQISPAIPKELLIRDFEGKITYLPLDRDRIMLGRSSACQLCYPDDAGLSRQHMALTKVNGQWMAEDLGSKNGTLVNDRRIEAATPVGMGDKIVAGHLELELSDALPGAAGRAKSGVRRGLRELYSGVDHAGGESRRDAGHAIRRDGSRRPSSGAIRRCRR